jgi:hypothetical protein
MNHVIVPYPLAIIVCDAIHIDQSTGKRTLLGLFSEIGASAFPCRHPLLAVHVSLTDGRGLVPLKFRLVDCDEVHDPLFEATSDVPFTDPRAIMEFGFAIPNLEFPAPGEYRFQVFANNEFVIERRLIVRQIGGPTNEQA